MWIVADVPQPRRRVERIADEVDDARVREEFGQRFDLGAEGGILGDIIFFAGGVQMPLEHGLVKRHDLAFFVRGDGLVEVVIARHLVHEWEEEGDEVAVPNMQVDVFILFRLEEGDGMYL